MNWCPQRCFPVIILYQCSPLPCQSPFSHDLPVAIFFSRSNSHYFSQYSQTAVCLRYSLLCQSISTIPNSLMIFTICLSNNFFDNIFIYHKIYILKFIIILFLLALWQVQQYHLYYFLLASLNQKPFLTNYVTVKEATEKQTHNCKQNTTQMNAIERLQYAVQILTG